MAKVSASRSYNDVAKQVRNVLRRHCVESVADCALQSLHFFRGKGLEELRSAPWLSALIVKICLEDEQTPISSDNHCPPALFDRLRQLLWEVSPINTGSGPETAYLALRVMMHTQLQFQLKESWSFLRWPSLISALDANHPSRRHFEAELKMSPTTFIGMCWACYTAIIDGRYAIRKGYFDPLRPLYGDAIDTYLEMFSRDLLQLREELRPAFQKRLKYMRDKGLSIARDTIEVAEFPWIQRYPLLRTASDQFVVWHPLIFARGMEQAVHQTLSSLGQEYTDYFSKVFERYVLNLLAATPLRYVDEQAFKAKHQRNSPAVEAIIELESGSVLIESKMSLFPDAVISSDSRDIVFRKLRRVREAIVQGWRVTELLSQSGPSIEGSNRENFLLVVTSRQLNICSGIHLQRLLGPDVFEDILPEDRLGPPSEIQRNLLPAENVFFVSIEEFEHISGCLRQKEIELWPLLKKAAAEQKNPATSVFHFDQLLGEHTSRWTLPDVQQRTRDEVEAQLLRLFAPASLGQ
jgi:hypothetical protein